MDLGQNRRKSRSLAQVVAAYCPVINRSEMGSSHQQQLHYFRSQKDQTCPQKLFDKHLKEQLQEWIAAEDQIILGIDANEDI